MTISNPGESADYRAARDRLLADEIALRERLEAVAAARRALPPGGLVPEDYVFDGLGADGRPAKVRLSELFAPGKDALVVYCYMFPRHHDDTRPGPEDGATAELPLEQSPCPSCTAFLDGLDGAAPHVEAGGANLVVVAGAPLERVVTFAREHGWRHLRLLSAAGNSFKRDYHAEAEDGSQVPLTLVFHRDGDEIRHFWSSELMFAGYEPDQDPRHNGTLDIFWNVLDLTPAGRGEGFDSQLVYDVVPPRVALPA